MYEQMNDTENSFIYNRYHFWIVIGIMLYLAGSFFIYIFADQVNNKTIDQYWFLTHVFYILKNVMITISLILLVNQRNKPTSEKFHPYLN